MQSYAMEGTWVGLQSKTVPCAQYGTTPLYSMHASLRDKCVMSVPWPCLSLADGTVCLSDGQVSAGTGCCACCVHQAMTVHPTSCRHGSWYVAAGAPNTTQQRHDRCFSALPTYVCGCCCPCSAGVAPVVRPEGKGQPLKLCWRYAGNVMAGLEQPGLLHDCTYIDPHPEVSS